LISKQNNHKVSEEQEPLAQSLFDVLVSFSHTYARNIEKNITGNSMQNLPEFYKKYIIGSGCDTCGFLSTNKKNIDFYIFPHIMRNAIIDGLKNVNLISTISEYLSIDLNIFEIERNEIKNNLERSNIHYIEKNGFMRPCFNCNSNYTSVRYWTKSIDKKSKNNIFCKYSFA
jgi:hypothetical protein